jgi:hypothetical protein
LEARRGWGISDGLKPPVRKSERPLPQEIALQISTQKELPSSDSSFYAHFKLANLKVAERVYQILIDSEILQNPD